MLYLLFTRCLLDYTEQPVDHIKFDGEIENITLENVELLNKELVFAVDTKKSLLKFNDPIPERNWSAEVELVLPKLNFPEMAGMYFWYDKQSDTNHSKYSGFAVGFELIGDSVELMIAIHENSEKEKVVKDFLDPTILKNHSQVKIKIINTTNNIKVELYTDNFLIYDHLRLLDKSYFGEHPQDGKFSISTFYNQVSKKDALRIKKITLLQRDEHKDYDTLNEISLPTSKTYEQNKYEISEISAKLEHFYKYIQIVLGKPSGATIAKKVVTNKDEILRMTEDLSKLKELTSSFKKISTKEIHKSANALEAKIRSLQKEMIVLQKSLKELLSQDEKGIVNIYLVLIAISMGLTGTLIKKVWERKKELVDKRI